MTTVLELVANLIRTSSDDLAEIANKSGSANFNFKANEKARTIHSQLTECCVINQWTSQVLNDRKMSDMTMEQAVAFFQKAENDYDTLEKANAFLASATAHLIAAVHDFPVEKLDDPLTMPWGETRTFLTLATLAVWNMNYHQGQINYIHLYLAPEAA